MLHDVVPNAPAVKGFLRSRHSVTDVVRKVLESFPDKDPVSLRKIIKVRPRQLEKSKTRDYSDGERAPRWAYVGPGSGLGYLAVVRRLFAEGRLTVAEVAGQVAGEFGLNPVAILPTIQVRAAEWRRVHGPDSIPRQLAVSRRRETRARNARLGRRRRRS